MSADPFSKGYKHRHGEPVSDACGDGRHDECNENYQTCHCTYRSGHKTMHLYVSFDQLQQERDRG